MCVQVTDVFEFLPSSVPGGSLQFLCCAESTGYRHLYLVTATLPGESFSQVLKAECSTQQLTTGNWVVFGSKVSLQTYQSKLCTVLRICAHTHMHTYIHVHMPRFGWTQNIKWCFLRPMSPLLLKSTCKFYVLELILTGVVSTYPCY